MDDTLFCPICGNKFRNIKLNNKTLLSINKTANFMERTCAGTNHVLILFSDVASKKIDFMKLSLDPKYSRFLEIDFINKKCRISCFKNSNPKYIEITNMIVPDFPKLEALKSQVELYIILS